MSRVVWKYDLTPGVMETQFLGSPKVVHVGNMFPDSGRNDTPSVWIEHDPDDGDIERIRLQVFGTGHPIPHGWEHVGSVTLPSCGLVWHVYENVGEP